MVIRVKESIRESIEESVESIVENIAESKGKHIHRRVWESRGEYDRE